MSRSDSGTACGCDDVFRRLSKGLLVALGISYPFAVYLLLGAVPIRSLFAVGLAAVAARAISMSRAEALAYAPLGAVLGSTLGAGFLLEDPMYLLFVPVLTSAGLLALFGLSMTRRISFVEKLALSREPNLPPEGRAYCRRLTIAWCGVFLLNGTVALWTVLRGSMELWALYNGFLSYILIGAFAGGEYLYRRSFKRRVSNDISGT